MNLRDFKYLIAVADTRHFGQAAEKCHVSQPTLSGQVKKLEEELGVMIFERTKRSVEVTPLGETIIEQARQVLEQTNALQMLAQSNQDPLAGPFRLGVITTLSPYLIPIILKPLRRKYPQIQLILTEELTDSLTTRLANHEIDAALIATQPEEVGIKPAPLFREPFWLACPENHPLSSKAKITHKDLNSAGLLLLSDGHCLAKQVMEVCHITERSTQGDMADLRAASLETLLELVATGFGCTLLPALALKAGNIKKKGIKLRELNLNDTHRDVSLVSRSTFPRPQVLDAITGIIRGYLPDSVTPLQA